MMLSLQRSKRHISNVGPAFHNCLSCVFLSIGINAFQEPLASRQPVYIWNRNR